MIMIDGFPDKHNQSSFYYITNDEDSISSLRPKLTDDVIRLYHIDDLADALARTNPDGSKGVKLRKSYKSHIVDLPGKHVIPTEDKSFLRIALQPENPDFAKTEIQTFEMNYLEKVINMEKTGPNGVHGFDSAKLALASPESIDAKKEKKRKTVASPEQAQQPDLKKRHVQVNF